MAIDAARETNQAAELAAAIALVRPVSIFVHQAEVGSRKVDN